MMMTRCFDSLCPTQGLRGDGPQRHQGIEDNNGQALEWDEGKKRGDIPMANNQFHHSEKIFILEWELSKIRIFTHQTFAFLAL